MPKAEIEAIGGHGGSAGAGYQFWRYAGGQVE
jgi:hypothetical protein